MPNIKLQYQYRDYANYKNYNEVIFTNPDNHTLQHITTTLRTTCMDNEYFLASRWNLKDLHFDKYDDEIDHPWHEFVGVQVTDEVVTEAVNISELLQKVKGINCVF